MFAPIFTPIFLPMGGGGGPLPKSFIKFFKYYGGFTAAWGLYGFSRGYRGPVSEATHYHASKADNCHILLEKYIKKILFTEKIGSGLTESIFYVIPIANLSSIFNLFKRIDIYCNNCNRLDYTDAFKENYSSKTCYDII